ncbi:hypothetical protein ACWKWU_14335, partial [Chitinophaga lutea]
MKYSSTKLLFAAFILLLSATLPAKAQLILVREVTASAGGSGTAGNFVFDYTIGETAVSSIANGGLLFTQGFQQPEILLAPPPGVSPILDYMIFP